MINPYVKYPTQTAAPDADYPYGGPQNVTLPGDNTGTPFDAEGILGDTMGFFQKLVDVAGITPSGNAETVPASDLYDALLGMIGGIGSLTERYGSDNPNSDIWVTSAATVARTSFPDLADILFPDLPFTQRTAGSSYTGTFATFTYGNGIYVAAGSLGEIQTSTDLATWTRRVNEGSITFTAACYKNVGGTDIYLVGGTGGNIYRSTDGTTYAALASTPSTAIIYDIIYDDTNSLFIACCSGGEIWTSADGTSGSWTSQTTPTANSLFALGTDGSVIVAVGQSNTIITATDPTGTWTSRTSDAGAGTGIFRFVANDGTRFLIGGTGFTSPYFIQTSPDAITWTKGQQDATTQPTDGTYGNGIFVTMSGTSIQRSYDASEWKVQSPVAPIATNEGILEVDGDFLFGCTNGKILTAPSDNFLIPTFTAANAGFTAYMRGA